MKYSILLLLLFSTLHLFGLDQNPNNNQLNSSVLVLKKGLQSITIEEGKNILIRVGNLRYMGKLNIVNDSTISLNNIPFLLSEIDMIAKSKTGKTIGLSLPGGIVGLVGIAIISISEYWDGTDRFFMILGGVGTVAIGVGATGIESYRGKRHRAYYHSKMNQVKKIRKWAYSIQPNN